MAAAGAGVAEMLAGLADVVRIPVLLSRDAELLYAATREHEHGAVAAAWEAAARGLPDAPASFAVPLAVAGDPQWGIATVIGAGKPAPPAPCTSNASRSTCG